MDSAVLLAQSRAAIERFDLAKAAGNPSEVEVARRDLERIKASLEEARTEAVTLGPIKRALLDPRRIGL